MTEEKILNLISLAKKKNELLNQIILLTKNQGEEIEGEKYEDLNRTLWKKDSIIKKIDKLDASFLEIFYKLKKENSIDDINELNVDDYPQLKELKKETKEIMSNLLTISMLDGKNNEAIKIKLKKAEKDLKKIRLGKRAYKGYNYKMTESLLIDKKK